MSGIGVHDVIIPKNQLNNCFKKKTEAIKNRVFYMSLAESLRNMKSKRVM